MGGLVLLAPGLVHDVDGVQVLEKDRVELAQVEFDGGFVDLLGLAQRIGIVRDLRGLFLGALHREHDVVGGQRPAVVELHALAQFEGPLQRAVLLPLGGERRHEGQLLVARDKEFVDLAVQRIRERLVLRHRVGGQQVTLARPAKGLGLRRRRKERGRADGDPSFHHHASCSSGKRAV